MSRGRRIRQRSVHPAQEGVISIFALKAIRHVSVGRKLGLMLALPLLTPFFNALQALAGTACCSAAAATSSATSCHGASGC
jgi:hypothetical protein